MKCPLKKWALVTFAILAPVGCATLVDNGIQTISVSTALDTNAVSGARCTLSNDAGQWQVTTPGVVTLQKSYSDLIIDCQVGSVAAGHQKVMSQSSDLVVGDVLATGGIGYLLDRNTGAGFEYPSSVTVYLLRKNP